MNSGVAVELPICSDLCQSLDEHVERPLDNCKLGNADTVVELIGVSCCKVLLSPYWKLALLWRR